MTNFLNPLEWVRSAQDWFTRSERSSGFRPYLIFLILVFGFALPLFIFFSQNQLINYLAAGIVAFSIIGFVILFSIKAFQDPDFCRSEKHIQRLKKLEIESLGTESKQVDARIVEEAPLVKASYKSALLGPSNGGKTQ